MIIVVIHSNRCPIPKIIFNIHFYFVIFPYLRVLFCKIVLFLQTSKRLSCKIYLLHRMFSFLFCLTRHVLPLYSLFTLLSHFIGFPVSTNYNLWEPICKHTTIDIRLVSKGCTQTYGVDYQEAFSFIAKLNIVRVTISTKPSHLYTILKSQIFTNL